MTQSRFSRRRAVLWTALLASALTLPARADWLVLRTGERAETRGPWKVKGRLVVFTSAKGNLASLRLADVDLEASERVTAEARAQAEKPPEPPPPPPPPQKEVRSLTDADFARRPPTAPAEGEEATKEGEEKESEPKPEKSPVTVSSWNQMNRTEGDGLDLVGSLRNNGNLLATDLILTVRVYDDEGGLLATADGILASTALPPGGTTSFRVPLPGVFTFARASFETRNVNVTLDPVPEGEEDGANPPNPGL